MFLNSTDRAELNAYMDRARSNAGIFSFLGIIGSLFQSKNNGRRYY